MEMEEAFRFTAACSKGSAPPCAQACPLHLDVKSFLSKMHKGSWEGAYRLLKSSLIFPEIVSALCHGPCRDSCPSASVAPPVAIQGLEQACLAWAAKKKSPTYALPAKRYSLAIIGGGVSGLACALRMAAQKYQVSLFELQPEYGGRLRYHPQAAVFMEDIARQISQEKIDFHFSTHIENLDGLLQEYDAVYLAPGSGGNCFGYADSWDSHTLSTGRAGLFLGGEVSGVTLVEAIAQGARAAHNIEIFWQTGSLKDLAAADEAYKPVLTATTPAATTPAIFTGEVTFPTQEKAKEEAGRCQGCDCQTCIQDCELLRRGKKDPRRIAKEVYTDTLTLPQLSGRTITRHISSCNICGHCRTLCPQKVDMGALALFARRDRVAARNYPPAFHGFWMEELAYSLEQTSLIRLPRGEKTCNYAFFPGCRLGASSKAYVKSSYAFLQKKFEGKVGLMLQCCGAPAYWAGEETWHKNIIAGLKDTWQEFGRPTMIFACAKCASIWREFLPEAPSVSLYELLEPEASGAKAAEREMTIFHPCSAQADGSMRHSIEALAQAYGVQEHKLPYFGKCCGWGGHMQVANPSLFSEIVAARISDSDRPYLVYCANCRDVFAAAGKPCLHILDLVFELNGENRPAPNIDQKRGNARELKQELLAEYWEEGCIDGMEAHDGVQLTLSAALRREMEAQLVAEADLQQAIEQAERTGHKFYQQETGRQKCCLNKGFVTIWVEYRLLDTQEHPAYQIEDFYCHRMNYLEQ